MRGKFDVIRFDLTFNFDPTSRQPLEIVYRKFSTPAASGCRVLTLQVGIEVRRPSCTEGILGCSVRLQTGDFPGLRAAKALSKANSDPKNPSKRLAGI